MFLTKTFAIQDCQYYDSQTVDKSRYTITSGSASLTYGSNGLTVKGTVTTNTFVKNTALTLPTSYILECKLSAFGSGTNFGGLCIDDCLIDFGNSGTYIYKLSNVQSLTSLGVCSANDILKIEMDNGTMKIYINDVLKTTQTITNTGIYQHRTYNNRSLTVKDLKIKPL